MDVLFLTDRARRDFSNTALLRGRWGEEGVERITLRLQQMAAAPTLADMRSLPGRCNALDGDRAGCFAVDVHRRYRLVFQPSHSPAHDCTHEDWSAVDSVTIVEIVDTPPSP